MRTISCLLSAAFAVAPISCEAAMLRPFSQITAATVHLADLFDDLGAVPDRVLGTAPSPGARIVVPAAQLAAIARDYDVAWRPGSGAEQAIVERRGDVLPRASILAALRRSLADAGAPEDCDVATPDVQPVLVPAGSAVQPDISQLNYDVQGGRFTAMLSVSSPDMPAVQMRVSGQVVPMVRAAVATHRLPPGSVVGDGDVQMARVRLASLHGATPLTAEAASGLSARRDLQAGQTLTAADLVRPALVQRGSVVSMRLDSEGLTLSAQGIATQPGARGDRIRIENPVSHQMVVAEVTGPGEVRVAPRGATITLVSAQ